MMIKKRSWTAMSEAEAFRAYVYALQDGETFTEEEQLSILESRLTPEAKKRAERCAPSAEHRATDTVVRHNIWLEDACKAHERLNPFTYTLEGGSASFAAWSTRHDTLRELSVQMRRGLFQLEKLITCYARG